ncbi:MAG: hypothetical protein KDI56_05200 [Xanthomonadales bacterium]|nr:hypothetical protein [Xanthomonadales bacterium]MCB1634426.1 hypothetical protein [Xanthomonadales bacterium]
MFEDRRQKWVIALLIGGLSSAVSAGAPDDLLGFWRDANDPAAWIEYREDQLVEWLDGRRMSASPIEWQIEGGQNWIRFPGDPNLGERMMEWSPRSLRLHRVGIDVEIHLQRLGSRETLSAGANLQLSNSETDPGGGGCHTLLAAFGWQASSQLPASGSADYDPLRLLDGRSDTAWVEGVEGGGVGQRLSLQLDGVRQQSVPPAEDEGLDPVEAIVLEGLRLINGYPRSERLYQANGRVAQLALRLGDRELGRWSVQDHNRPQVLVIEPPLLLRRDEHLIVELTEVIAGERWQDTALAELQPIVHGCGQILAVD